MRQPLGKRPRCEAADNVVGRGKKPNRGLLGFFVIDFPPPSNGEIMLKVGGKFNQLGIVT